MKNPAKTLALLAASSALAAVSASAATINIGVSGDSYIRPSTSAAPSGATTNNNGSQLLLIGDTATAGDAIRAVLSFDLSAPELAGATINSVSLNLYANGADGSSGPTVVTIDVYQLTTNFTEAQVTWNLASTETSWATAGGDFSAALLSSHAANSSGVTANQLFDFTSSANFVSSVSTTLLQVDKTLGLMLKLDAENADAIRSVFRLNSGSTTNSSIAAAAYRPQLIIDYTAAAIPEPSSFAALAGLGMLGFASMRRRARR